MKVENIEKRRRRMKILYRQTSRKSEKREKCRAFEELGINNCYFKHIVQENADNSNTKKRHSHTGFEFHLMMRGSQTYESEEGGFCVKAGDFLMIPAGKPHKFISAEYPVEKYAITFSYSALSDVFGIGLGDDCCHGRLTERIMDRIATVEKELSEYLPAYDSLIENAVFEIAVCLIRECGGTMGAEKRRKQDDAIPGDARVELAKQFIDDNITEPLQVGEVAAYCYLSEKQLTRLFEANEGMSLASFIRKEKIRHIENLLADSSLTLAEISEAMGFPTEPGFNAFFKKYNGMPPGEYRRMIKN
jgi:AraC-like DNA-binding protein/mannose-6-phosphate isomerase-like protein (cupin superfamily)